MIHRVGSFSPEIPTRPAPASRREAGDGWVGSVEAISRPALPTSPAPRNLGPTGQETARQVAESLTVPLFHWKTGQDVSFDLSPFPALAGLREHPDLKTFLWSTHCVERLPALEKVVGSFPDPGQGLATLARDWSSHAPESRGWADQPRLALPEYLEAYPHARKLAGPGESPNWVIARALREAPGPDTLPVLEIAAGGTSFERAVRLRASSPLPPECLALAVGRCQRDEDALAAGQLLAEHPDLRELASQLPNEHSYFPYQVRGLRACLQDQPEEARPWALRVVACGAYWDEGTARELTDFILKGPPESRPERADAVASLYGSRKKDRDAISHQAARATLEDLQALDTLGQPLGPLTERFMVFRSAYGRDWMSLVAREEFLKNGLDEPAHSERFQHYLPLCKEDRNFTFSAWEPAVRAAALEKTDHPHYDAAERRAILTRLLSLTPSSANALADNYQAITAQRWPGQSIDDRLELFGRFQTGKDFREARQMFALVDGPHPEDAALAAKSLLDLRRAQQLSWRAPNDLEKAIESRRPDETLAQTAGRLVDVLRHPALDSRAHAVFALGLSSAELQAVMSHPSFQKAWSARHLELLERHPHELGPACEKLAATGVACDALKCFEAIESQRAEGESLQAATERFGRILKGMGTEPAALERLAAMSGDPAGQDRFGRVAESLPGQVERAERALDWLSGRPDEDVRRVSRGLSHLQAMSPAEIDEVFARAESMPGDRVTNLAHLSALVVGQDVALAEELYRWAKDLPGDLSDNVSRLSLALEMARGDVEVAKATLGSRPSSAVEIHRDQVTVGGIRLRTRSR